MFGSDFFGQNAEVSYWDDHFLKLKDRYYTFIARYYDRAIKRARDESYAIALFGGGPISFLKVDLTNDLAQQVVTEFTGYWKLNVHNPIQRILEQFPRLKQSYLNRIEHEEEMNNAVRIKPHKSRWGIFSATHRRNIMAIAHARRDGKSIVVDNGKIPSKPKKIRVSTPMIEKLVRGNERDVVHFLVRYFAYEQLNHEKKIEEKLQSSSKADFSRLFPNSPVINHVIGNPKLKWSQKWGSKIDLIRLLIALRESGYILGEDGEPATQVSIMEEFGGMLNIDLSDYSDHLSKATKANESTNSKFFDKLKKAFHEYSQEKQEKNLAD